MTTATKPRVVHVHDKVPGAVYIGRAVGRGRNHKLARSPFANPFKCGMDPEAAQRLLTNVGCGPVDWDGILTREDAIWAYRTWIGCQPTLVARAKVELAGKDLACWCAPQACHGDVLLEIANTPGSTERGGGNA